MLLVEDEAPVARAMERWLKRQGAQVQVLHDSDGAEALLQQQWPSIVISDYLMPGLDGVQVLALAKALNPTALRCLLSGSLFMVSAAVRESIAPCLFVEKPWDGETLRVQLGLTLEGSPS